MKLFSVWLCFPSQGCYGYLSRSLVASCGFLSLLRYFSHNHLLAMVQPVLDMKFKSISRVNKSITKSSRYIFGGQQQLFWRFLQTLFLVFEAWFSLLKRGGFFPFPECVHSSFHSALPIPFHYMSINKVWTGAWTNSRWGGGGGWIGLAAMGQFTIKGLAGHSGKPQPHRAPIVDALRCSW